MRVSRFRRGCILIVVFAMIFAACSGGNDKKAAPAATSTTTAVPLKTVKIGVIAPLGGPSTVGVGIRNAVELAIKQANEAKKIKGWTIALAAEDDAGKPDVGAQAATKLAADETVAGVVGTRESSVALQVQPVLDRAGIVLVSPANSSVELTQGTDPATKKRPFPTYFRLATTDAVEGPFAANFATKDLNAKDVVTINDKSVDGRGLVAAFTSQLTKNGAAVVAAETINPSDQDFGTTLAKIKALNPDLVFFGGEATAGSLLARQINLQGIKAPLMGGGGIFDPAFITSTGQAAEGSFCTSSGAPPDQLDSATALVDAYAAAKYKEDLTPFGAYAYDAANVIIEALAKVLNPTKTLTPETRKEIGAAVQASSFTGATGAIAFDEFGDNKARVVTMYRVTNQAWTAVKTDDKAA